MAEKPYIFQIDVTAKSPKGLRELNGTFRGIGLADNVPNAKAVLEKKAVEFIKQQYDIQYPGMPMQFTAKSTRIKQDFLIAEDAESVAQTEQKDEPNE